MLEKCHNGETIAVIAKKNGTPPIIAVKITEHCLFDEENGEPTLVVETNGAPALVVKTGLCQLLQKNRSTGPKTDTPPKNNLISITALEWISLSLYVIKMIVRLFVLVGFVESVTTNTFSHLYTKIC